MLIDWFTVGAQALNFLILVWLMKRFLYKPILHAIDEREKRIAAELAAADARRAEAQEQGAEFQRKSDELDQQRAALLRQATDEANAEGQRLRDGARKAADALAAKRMDALRRDAREATEAIRRRAQQEVFAIARKTLADLATASLEERISDVFGRRLEAMTGKEREGLAQALQNAASPTLVRSTFDLPEDQRTAIRAALNKVVAADVPVRFETAPDLIAGIELTANGQKVAWSIADYLAALTEAVDTLVKEQDDAGETGERAPDTSEPDTAGH